MVMELRWTGDFEIDDAPIRECLDQLVCLRGRGLLTVSEINRIADILKDGEIPVTTCWRDGACDRATGTSVDSVTFEPTDALKNLMAAIRTGPA